METDSERTGIINDIINWAKIHRFSRVKANSEGFETPTSFRQPDDDETFIPDVTAVKLGSKNYFEVALKTDDRERTIRKWKLLSTLAEMKNGTLYLFAPRGHKAFASRIVDKRNLNAEVIAI